VRTVSPFRRVLVGFDGSPDAAAALGAGTAIAVGDGGHVVALCVLPSAMHEEGHEQDGGGVRKQAEDFLAELARVQRADKPVRMSVQVVYSDRGSAADVVTDYAEQHGFDILVLGRHGDGAHRKSRLGRVTDRAAQACSVPVLVVSAR